MFYPYAVSIDALAALASAALISGKDLLSGKTLTDKLCPFRKEISIAKCQVPMYEAFLAKTIKDYSLLTNKS